MRTEARGRTFARAGRRTNVALFWLVVGAFVTGWVGFAVARPVPSWLVAALHALLGLAVVALAPWKSMIIRRSRLRVASVLLLVAVVLGLAAGFVQLFAGWSAALGISPLQVHVGASLIALPLLGWHVLRRGGRAMLAPRRSDLSRRVLLRGLGGLGAVSAGYLVLTALSRSIGGPPRTPAATGSRAVDPDAIPATIWLLDRVPELAPTHRVEVAGRSYGAAELAEDAEQVNARLDCTSGWFADATWSGRRVADLIPVADLAAARSVLVTSATGYRRRFPAAEAGSLWLAVACQGRPLTAASGAPVRLVVPGRRGFWWVKWVARVELSDQPSWAQPPFPAQ
ncbi:molybdopterin-dependent oxidoreductase [Microlunatus ginsengisoli]|uniref:molybdopterin-dependent oxidoreductase n=1 Tax=Microlunatus ginsengisoli TaxID=363863 RepID=UPI0031E245C3